MTETRFPYARVSSIDHTLIRGAMGSVIGFQMGAVRANNTRSSVRWTMQLKPQSGNEARRFTEGWFGFHSDNGPVGRETGKEANY